MADRPREQSETEFELATGALGALTCRRITLGARMRVLRHIGDDLDPTPQKVARALLRAIAIKPDGSEVAQAEADAVTDSEIETFAGSMLRLDDSLRPAGWTLGDPAMAALATGLKAKEKKLFGTTSSLSALKDSVADAAARAMGSSAPSRRPFTGVPRADVEKLVAGVPPKPRPAEIALRMIMERREAFAATLPEDREAAMVVASGPGGPCFYTAEAEAITADLISFRGLDDDGEPVEILQDASQCNVMFLPIRKAATRGPLGFGGGAK